jgi:UDP-N-acetylmuramoyl-tripeptide--D-alanyl-D-alanine ligase
VIEINVKNIITATKGKLLFGDETTEVKDISIDSRKVDKGYMFIPIIGERFDGHSFIEDAFNKGASVALTSKSIDNIEKYSDKTIIKVDDTLKALQDIAKYFLLKLNLPVVAVTGSTGKTTTKELIYNVLSQKYRVLKNEGNFNNHIGLPLTLLNLNNNHEIVVLEMGMSGRGEIDLLSKIATPQTGVITNIGVSHIEKLGSQEEIFNAKMELTNYMDENSVLIINGDDKFLKTLKNRKTKYGKVFAGLNKNNNIYATDTSNSNEYGIAFTLHLNNNTYNFDLKIPGRHNIYNALLAICVGLHYNVSMNDIIKGINSYTGNNMRLNIINLKDIKIVNDCYNASPDSMKAALEVLRQVDCKRKISVLGDMFEMGNFSENAHISVGHSVYEYNVDILITVGDKARNIAKGAVQRGFKEKDVFITENNSQAIEILKKIMKAGDTILVKGSRGMHMEEIVEFLLERS